MYAELNVCQQLLMGGKITHISKITQHMVPNIDGTILHKIKTRNHPRHGTKYFYRVPIFETKRNNAQSYHENVITVLGPRTSFYIFIKYSF